MINIASPTAGNRPQDAANGTPFDGGSCSVVALGASRKPKRQGPDGEAAYQEHEKKMIKLLALLLTSLVLAGCSATSTSTPTVVAPASATQTQRDRSTP